ncbi:MAG: hypothetical protein OEX77_05255 [Candidatus Bathyarchaeota archaeon]|nr:hypothetical protein [Candidatus Bathyarchaeota archaeon]MDH5732799.1 hypothetical protein [Candidatus Bathyarchaeota archaeon]
MVSKDQGIGGLIFIVCVIVAIGYVVALILPTQLFSLINAVPPIDFQLWLVAIPVLIAFLVVLFIGAWIGWTMATTPPPRPLEEIEAEEKVEEEKKD